MEFSDIEKRDWRFQLIKETLKKSPPDPNSHISRRRKVLNRKRKSTNRFFLQLVKAYGHRCAYCDKQRPLTRDHIVPIMKGGENCPSNIVPACAKCNQAKGNGHYKRPRPPRYPARLRNRNALTWCLSNNGGFNDTV